MPNDIKLQSPEGKHPLDENLRPLKIGDKSSSLELAQHGNGARVNGDLDVTGFMKGKLGDIFSDDDMKIDSTGVLTIKGFTFTKIDEYIEFDQNGSTGAGASMKLMSILDTGDYCLIDTATHGATTISTVDDDGNDDADLTLDIDGKISLDSATGEFEMKKAGTKFADTYAGMILGYTRIQNDGTGAANNAIVVNTSSMTVLQTDQGTDFSIQFIVPPSGNVEIQCSFWMQGSSDGAKFSLSTGTSYAELGITHTYDADQVVYLDETDHNYNTVSFSVTGLTAGTDTTYYVAAIASGAGIVINHGRFRTTGTHFPPIILRAIALPATIVTGE